MAVLRSIPLGGAVLVHASSALLAGCYTPELRDCAVSCANQADCAPGQVCGADAFCAAPAVAGTCVPTMLVDAGPTDAATPLADARPNELDAAVPPLDAPAFTLTIKIGGRGRVIVAGVGQCDHTAPNEACMFGVTPGVTLELTALPVLGTRFEEWKQACTGQDELCELTPLLLHTFVEAKFKTDDDDD